MSTFDSLHERLSALQETATQLRELIDRLANLRFEPGSVPLPADPNDTDNVVSELSLEINQTLRDEEDDLELLREEIADLPPARPGSEADQQKTRLRDGAALLQADLDRCRTDFRKAQLAARRNLEAAQRRERELLLASYAATAAPSPASSMLLPHPGDNAASGVGTTSPNNDNNNLHQTQTQPPQPQPTLSPEEVRAQLLRRRHHHDPSSSPTSTSAEIRASHDITLALQRTHALIAGEVAKSAFAARTLAESTAALAELQRSYEGVEGLLTRSRELVSALAAQQKSDSWYLAMALRMLLVTLAWLVFRRFLYGPLWWLVWLPLRTGYRVGSATVGRVGSGSGSGAGLSSSESLVGVTMAQTNTVVAGTVGVPEERTVPTVRVGREQQEGQGQEGEPESMVEKVGRMVEDTLDPRDASEGNKEQGDLTEAAEPEPEPEANAEEVVGEEPKEEEYQPNPKKRMWEEPVGGQGAGEAQGVRDEL